MLKAYEGRLFGSHREVTLIVTVDEIRTVAYR
jgi:hypothetical protein